MGRRNNQDILKHSAHGLFLLFAFMCNLMVHHGSVSFLSEGISGRRSLSSWWWHLLAYFSLVHRTQCVCVTQREFFFFGTHNQSKKVDRRVNICKKQKKELWLWSSAQHMCFTMSREEMSWLMIVIFFLWAWPTYLEAPYLPSSIWWWRQAYCSWQCRSSLSRCPRSVPHPWPRWWGYQEELWQDKQNCVNTGGIKCRHTLCTTWWGENEA